MHAGRVLGNHFLKRKSSSTAHISRQSRTFATTRWLSIAPQDRHGLPSRTRNIGIIAHIDAGKTTTTERMLFYSGHTRRIGDVDDGSTVTDFLPAERARGITIQSAAITFHWPPLANVSPKALPSASPPLQDDKSFTINLIDTPGHADFTFEVLRSLRILDGAVCILDGVAGVEAQTEKVWTQAQSYRIPKIIYINKLDRDGAAFGKTVKEIAAKLHVWPALCQIPWYDGGQGAFVGVVDVVNLRALRWTPGDGTTIMAASLDELDVLDPSLAREARRARVALVELLSEYDDAMVEKYLEKNEDHLAILPSDIVSSLRGIHLSGKSLVPVFAGASFRNIGVQPLLDAITHFLPSPGEAPDAEFTAGPIEGRLRDLTAGDLSLAIVNTTHSKRAMQVSKKATVSLAQTIEACALAFKVVQDAKRGVLVYVRVYHGTIQRNANLYNTALQVTERAPRVLRMYAQDAVEVASLPAGHIGVITGLKHTRTGDTLIVHPALTGHGKSAASHLTSLALRPITVPPPLFFASIEPHSLRDQADVTEALNILLREDPSLHISIDPESGQTLLSGMGELHLEIARDRLVQDLRARCAVGKIDISYRETPTTTSTSHRALVDRIIAGRAVRAACSAAVAPIASESLPSSSENSALSRDGNLITIAITSTLPASTSADSPKFQLSPHVYSSLQSGALAALARSPNYFLPLHATHVHLTLYPATDLFGVDSTPAALSSAARTATHAALRAAAAVAPSALVEPVMLVHIDVDERSLGTVVQDLSARGGIVVALDGGRNTPGDGESREIGRKHVDLARVYAPPDPFGAQESEAGGNGASNSSSSSSDNADFGRQITARVPLREMLGYLRHLRSLTGGRGSFVMNVDGFEKVGGQRTKTILRELRGEVG